MYDRTSNAGKTSTHKVKTDPGIAAPDGENNLLPVSNEKTLNAATGAAVFKKPTDKHKPPSKSNKGVSDNPNVTLEKPIDIVRLVRFSNINKKSSLQNQ